MTKHTLVAIGLLALGPCAMAQSSVTIYGMLDVGLRRVPNLAESEAQDNQVSDASRNRIGFRGKEDLGGGLSAFFRLEHSIRVDTGTQRDAVKFWDDKAWVGLDDARFGNIALGRLRSPIDEMTSGSRFEAFEGFSLAAAGGRTNRAEDGWDRAVYYITPRLGAFRAGAGARANGPTARRATGLHVEYTQGPVDVGLAYQVDGETLVSNKTSYGGGLAVNFGVLTMFSTYVRTVDVNATDTGTGYTATLGARVPMGPGEFRIAGRKVDNKHITSAASFAGDVDSTQLGIGYKYPLSKRTSINTSLVRLTRKTYTAAGAVATDRGGYGAEVALRITF